MIRVGKVERLDMVDIRWFAEHNVSKLCNGRTSTASDGDDNGFRVGAAGRPPGPPLQRPFAS